MDKRNTQYYCDALDEESYVLRSVTGEASLGRLFQYDIQLASVEDNMVYADVLGKNISIEFSDEQDRKIYINAIISQIKLIDYSNSEFFYLLTLVPDLWTLKLSNKNQIFQKSSVIKTIEKVLDQNEISEVRFNTYNDYPPIEYLVQFNESNFSFISRLCEHYGLYFYFEHEKGKHTLIFSDDSSLQPKRKGYESAQYFPAENKENREQRHIYQWSTSSTICTGEVTLIDYDYDKPKKKLSSKSLKDHSHDYSQLQHIHYPGGYKEDDNGASLAQVSLQSSQNEYDRSVGVCNIPQLAVGDKFTLSGYFRDEFNKEYVIISTRTSIRSNDTRSGGSAMVGMDYECMFSVIPADIPYQLDKETHVPVIHGPQTGVVTGPDGEEIWTDKKARVKVKFHWDVEGEDDENSSCWLRVAQMLAHDNWGGQYIPRIGQEVLIEFLNGDPDRPLVTGAVYNGMNQPPLELPDNKTQSGLVTRSSKGGSTANANSIIFEDKKGKEKLSYHAEKDHDFSIENDEAKTVGHDRSLDVGNDETVSIGNNRTETVGVDESITIGNNRTESVGVNETITIGSSRSVTIGQNKSETIAVNKAETIGVAKELTIGGMYQVTVGGAMNETVAIAKAQEVGATKATVVGGSVSETYGSSQSTTIAKDHTENVGKNQTIQVGENQTIKVGKNLTIDAGDQIVIKTGKASITMKKDGSIDIVGKDIQIKGSGKIDVKASKDVTMKGKKILQN